MNEKFINKNITVDVYQNVKDLEKYIAMNYDDMNIKYILYNSKDKTLKTLISDDNENSREISLNLKNLGELYTFEVPEWDFNFDYYIYNDLEIDKNKIIYISPDTHYGIWNSLAELYPEDIDCKEGVQKYLKFCKNNKITKEKIESCNDDMKLPFNCMEFYKENQKEKER